MEEDLFVTAKSLPKTFIKYVALHNVTVIYYANVALKLV